MYNFNRLIFCLCSNFLGASYPVLNSLYAYTIIHTRRSLKDNYIVGKILLAIQGLPFLEHRNYRRYTVCKKMKEKL